MLFFSLSSVLGRLYLLRKPIHTGIALLAERYGPVFSLQFGSREAVVVSSAACMRRECFFEHNVRFVNRPRFPSLLLISFGGAEVRAMARRMCWFAAAAPSGGARVELKRRLFEVSLNALLETITRTRRPAPRQTPTRRLKTTLSVTGLSGRIQTEPGRFYNFGGLEPDHVQGER